MPEKTSAIDKSLSRITKKKREKIQINEIRDEKGDVTTGTAEAQRDGCAPQSGEPRGS